MNNAVASATAALTADEIIVETALGGARYCLPNFNKTINLAATGAGGMDTGTAPANGYVALYAIYNPATGGSALLASNATAAAAPNVYGGANMPAGYTASALVSVWPTNAGGQFAAAAQIDRSVYFAPIQVLSTTATVSTPAALNIAAAVPANARTWTGTGTTSNVTAGVGSFLTVAANTGQVGQRFISQTSPANGAGINVSLSDVLIQTPQTTYYTNTGSGAIGAVNITQYTF
ncbi:phage tail protein [Cupriavidus malaysiensis]|uniref:Phage tail protein n=1 Tax=Cupriavidus malaysiensis TaxID=367825 RepID=A0ABN4TLA4_9BURK|nr:phage tail protein [Cupriavidus malaysiensis]